MQDNFYSKYGKRIFDFVSALLCLVLLSPFFLLMSAIIKLTDKGPIFFRQVRVGQNFKLFKLVKFRTMIPDAEKYGPVITAENDSRITKIGKFLRKFKLDELPQLINVLKGEMSLVGPRPEVPKYVEMFKAEYEEILKIKPGITDYATIEFRDEEKTLAKYDNAEDGYIKKVLPKKIELYKKYLREQSFLTDFKLIILTLWKIIKKR